MVVVLDPGLEASWTSCRLDPSHQSGPDKRREHVVDRLRRDRADALMRRRCDLLDRQVVARSHRGQNSESRRGNTQAGIPEALGFKLGRGVQYVRHRPSITPYLETLHKADRYLFLFAPMLMRPCCWTCSRFATLLAMTTNSPQTTSRTSNESMVRATSMNRERIGRFDDGMATHPTINRERIGRFDDGMATHPTINRERIGRFDDGMATHPTINRERIGRFDEGIGEDRLAA